MKLWTVCACLVSCCAAFSQQFEVASIKPAEPMPPGQMRIGMNADAGMLRYVNVSLKDVIRTAYRMKDFQVQGPDWLANTRFDITAKLPEGSSKDQIPEMLQALLAERFKLEVHRESKEHAVYALVAGKGGPKLKPAEVQTNDKVAPVAGAAKAGIPPKPAAAQTIDKAVAIAGTAKGEMPRNAMMIAMGPEGAHLKAPSVTLAGLADMLSRFTERPVLDMTGIQGQYEFDLAFSPEQMRGMPGMMRGPMPPGGAERPAADVPSQPAASIFDSVQQYGLKLEPRKAPLDILIVDKIEKTPTEN